MDKDLLECFKISADFCGRSNQSGAHYTPQEFINLAFAIAKMSNEYKK